MQKYEIKGIVGEGAYGIVYQAKVKETGEIGRNRHYYIFKSACKRASDKIKSLKYCIIHKLLRRFVI